MKKLFVIILLALATASCGKLQGQKGEPGSAGPAGSPGSAGSQGPIGNPGQSAIMSSGPIGTLLHNGLSTCHHDYEFQSNHWLLLRHQKNGTGDQGTGSTGFDLWNVDIMDFLLISEVGNVTYCTLHFNSAAMTLKYTVNDSTDGKQGEVATINLNTGQVQ